MSDCDDGGESDVFPDRPVGVRPVGVRPIGVRPIGVRQLEDSELGRPVGVRPVGVRPVGVRPVGVRPVGVRPVGVRPVGVRPVGVRGGYLDPDEWAADIAEFVGARSAVIRLGATVVSDDYEIRVPVVDATPGAPAYVEEKQEKPLLEPRELKLRPRDHELAAKVVLPDRVAGDIARDPVLALAIKEDLAEALALRADQAFLSGVGPVQPARDRQCRHAASPHGCRSAETARDARDGHADRAISF